MRTPALALCGALTQTICLSTFGQCELDKLFAAESDLADSLGFSVSADDNVVIGGAPADLGDAGSACVFRYGGLGWVFEQRLVASDLNDNDAFGFSVALDGDTAVVGAPGNDDNGHESGAAYVFRFDGKEWSEEAKLVPIEAVAFDNVGDSVTIAGDLVVVGAAGSHTGDGTPGRAYVYRRINDAWVDEAVLVSSGSEQNDRFGRSVAIEGETVVVGAPEQQQQGAGPGAAYVFRFVDGAWFQAAELVPDDGESMDSFGRSVAISGSLIAVGAPNKGANDGAVYLFQEVDGSWPQQPKLVPADEQGAEFGHALGLNPGMLLVGAPGWGDSAGLAYLYMPSADGWAGTVLPASDRTPKPNEVFGSAVALTAVHSFVSSPAADGGKAGFYGVIDVFENLGPDCNANGVCDPVDVSSGTSPDQNRNGNPDECDIANGDVNLDGDVDVEDLVLVIATWGPCAQICPADTNSDGLVDVIDLVAVVTNWG